MNMKWSIAGVTGTLLAGCLLMGTAWAQSAAKPLNLQLPPSDIPAASATAPAPPTSVTSSTISKPAAGATAAKPGVSNAPGAYYGDTSGAPGETANAFDPRPPCDDSTYNNAQVHGSVSTGVVSGSRMGTGSYTGGEVSVTKALGDCDHPTGIISFSVGGTNSNFGGGRGYRGGY